MEREPKVHDEAPAIVDDHMFEPRNQWWSLCKHCGLARAAHSSASTVALDDMVRDHMETYGEVRYPGHPERKAQLEEQFRAFERKRTAVGGRRRLATYVSDDEDD
jgi:hypothetical protein